jgi:hypothetical protein
MFKRSILLGLTAGLLAGVASLIYQKVYASSLGTDFATIAQPLGIFFSCVFAGLLAAVGYFFLIRRWHQYGEATFNLIFVILSFASILAPFAMKLPLDMDMPELFPGLVVPMHFFPALAWFTLKPLFFRTVERGVESLRR